jgi:lipopolysaccharide export system protein LptA
LLRHGTAALIVAFVATMVAIAVHRIRELQRPVAAVDPAEMNGEGDDPVEGIYTGFKYVETVAGQLVFALDSIRTLGKSSGWHEIEGVRLQLYNQGEEGPVLTSESARFNIETRDAALRGPVTVEFPGGAMLSTERGHFESGPRRLVADSQVLFTNGQSVGRAGRAFYSLDDNRLELIQNAILRTDDGASVRAPRILYLRNHRRIEFPDGCTVARDGSRVTADRAVLELEENEGPVKRAVFSEGVTALSAGGPRGTIIEAAAERVVAVKDSKGDWQVSATTSGPWISVVLSAGEQFYERTLKTQVLRGVIGPEGVLSLRTEHRVCLREVPIEGDVRLGEARQARVWFENGDPGDMELIQDVVLVAGGIDARAYRARVSPVSGVTIVHGDPLGPRRAVLISERGKITCDQAQMFDREDRTEARGDVQGTLRDVVLLGTESESKSQPLHFAAGVLDITDSGNSFRLRTNARLWQGHRLLLADDVLYRQNVEVLEATGHVRTTIPAVQLDPSARPGDDVVVVARSLNFDRRQGSAVYVGNVRYSDPGHIMSANELIVSFDEQNTITAVEAVGAVELVDLAGGRRMTGQKARREVTTQTVHVTGSPVQLTDQSGTVISSSSLTWDQASGSVTLAGGTETIYYPEEAP